MPYCVEFDAFPEANTCSNIMKLSLLTSAYESFKYNICFGITNAVGFVTCLYFWDDCQVNY